MSEQPLHQNAVIGGLMGLAIGDALGFPFRGLTLEEIAVDSRNPGTYYGIGFEDGTSLEAGEFSDESETALCIVESYTVNSGEIDPENIRPRLEMLASGEAKRWMEPGSLDALQREHTGLDAWAQSDELPAGDVAARGVPLGLILAGDALKCGNPMSVGTELAALTHRHPSSGALIHDVAMATRMSAERRGELGTLPGRIAREAVDPSIASRLDEIQAEIDVGLVPDAVTQTMEVLSPGASLLVEAVHIAATSSDFRAGVEKAVQWGGLTDGRAGLTGALLGAWLGTPGIPQDLVDELEGRMYVLLAAPWFFRTIRLRSGSALSVIQQSDSNLQQEG